MEVREAPLVRNRDGRSEARLDQTDLALIRLLREDGRAGNRELGEALGISPGTVRSRIRRLIDAHIMRVTAITDFDAAGNQFFVMLCCQVEGRPVKDVARDLAQHQQIIAVTIVSGRYDIVASLVAHDRADLARIMAEDLAAVPGISAIESSVALDIVHSTSDWVARL